MFDEFLTQLLGAVRDLDPVLRITLAGLAIMLETSVLVGLVVPGDTVVLIASIGIRNPAEWAGTVAAALIGALCGESLGYAIGRFFGDRLAASRLGRWLGSERIAAAQGFVARRGGPGVFVSRFLPILHSVVPLAAGMSGMRYRRFILWTMPACLVWALAYVSAGAAAAASYEQLASRLHGAGYVLAGVVAVIVLTVWFAKRRIRRRVDRELAEDAAFEHNLEQGVPAAGAPERHDDADGRSTSV